MHFIILLTAAKYLFMFQISEK